MAATPSDRCKKLLAQEHCCGCSPLLDPDRNLTCRPVFTRKREYSHPFKAQTQRHHQTLNVTFENTKQQKGNVDVSFLGEVAPENQSA